MEGFEAMTKHALLMLACCLIPLAVLGPILVSGISLGGFLPFAIMLLCPLLHVLMMRGMGHDHSAHDHQPSADAAAQSVHGGQTASSPEAVGTRH